MENSLNRRHDKPTVIYFLIEPESEAQKLGGTGIFLASRLNYLKSLEDRLQLRVVTMRGADQGGSTILTKLVALIRYITRQLWALLSQTGDIYYLVYPKIPLVAHGVTIWTWLFAMIGYTLLWLRKHAVGTRIIVEIEDLPVESRHLRVSEQVPDLSRCNWQYLGQREKLYTILEWVIFRSADRILHPSQPFSNHVAAKFDIPPERMDLYRREIYMPTYETETHLGRLPGLREVNLFYSGNLTLDFLVPNLKQAIDAIADLPQVALYICGSGGAWVEARCQARGQGNVHYLGLLSHSDHDAVARQCQVGLMLYAHSYADFKCTAKYPAYVANGLAVLSTDLFYLSQVIEEDGVGKALPMPQLVAELRRWAAQPELVEVYRRRARCLAPCYLNGVYMEEWFFSEI
jgi:glycosyltransferase involved in cell wall biosynthesis